MAKEFTEFDEFDEWRERTRANLPELSARVFALRTKFYSGCGGHYDLEKRLGVIIAKLSDYSNRNFMIGEEALFNQLNIQVEVELLNEDINKAYQSAQELTVK